MRYFLVSIFVFAMLVLQPNGARAQETNPVDRKVANPVTDSPNVNPISPEERLSTANKRQESGYLPEGGGDSLVVYSNSQKVEGEEGKRIVTHEGNVDVRYGIYRLQADKIILYEETNIIEATGSVVFDQGEQQRITGTSATWNYKTKLGSFLNSTGYTSQTQDGKVLYFTADSVERTKLNEVVVKNGEFTACEEAVPLWSFTTDEATIVAKERVRLTKPAFRIKGLPIMKLPYVSVPIDERDRSSGFLLPTIGYSGDKGLRISGAYFQTLGRSADITFRADIFSERGVGYGFDLRTRANARSYFNVGFYGVKDRIFGAEASEENPDQGGTSIYAEGVHYFQNGFVGVADVRITSSLDFRQVFSDGVQQIISPIEVSQAYVNRSWGNYTMNILARSQVISIPNVRVKTRNLPSFDFEKRPSELGFLKNVYFSFRTSLEGISRREEVDSLSLYQQEANSDPVVTPAVGQRFDIHPQVTIPFNTKYFSITATAGGRATFYSNSFDDTRTVISNNQIRKYGELELDFRPVALAKNYYDENDEFSFRHTIEPYLRYRLVKGINNFRNIIRYDYRDTQTDTNEIEWGITNRFFTRRYAEAVTPEARNILSEAGKADVDPLSIQPYELFTLSVRGKYFFDPYFGGALVPGQRNQIAPITDITYYTFGGIARRFSPLIIDATYRPRRQLFLSGKMDYGVQGDGLRTISATLGYETKLAKFFQTFYYTRAVTLAPELAQYANSSGKEAGTIRGSQWSPAVFLGNREKGFYGGTSLFFDFQNRRGIGDTPLISSLFTLGYSSDCCSITTQFYHFNVGARKESRFVFSFTLNGIGSVGTEQYGQPPF